MEIINSFKQVDALQRRGINLCKGCEFERYASCHDKRLPICSKRYEEYIKTKLGDSAYNTDNQRK